MLNKSIFTGRFTANPELKTTPNGILVTNFSVAVDNNYEDRDGKRSASFIPVIAWRQTAEFICKYFEKGKMISIDGSLQSRSYTDSKGNNRTVLEVVVDNAYFGDSNKKASKPEDGSIPPPEHEYPYSNVGDMSGFQGNTYED